MKNKKNFWETTKRICRYKLIIPLIRAPHPPFFKARGVAIGMMWAMTPLVGIQMWLVFMTWLLLKKVFKWDFSLPLAIAYTWVTNVFTLVPVYYVFYLTGKIMMGNFDNMGYGALKEEIARIFIHQNLTFLEQWTFFFKFIMQDLGLAMVIGCIPWAIVCSVGSYYMTLKFFEKRENRKKQKAK